MGAIFVLEQFDILETRIRYTGKKYSLALLRILDRKEPGRNTFPQYRGEIVIPKHIVFVRDFRFYISVPDDWKFEDQPQVVLVLGHSIEHVGKVKERHTE